MEIMLEDYLPLIRANANYFALKHYKLEFDDLVQEGCLVFMKCLTSYKEDIVTFGAYLKQCLQNCFKNLLRKTNNWYEYSLEELEQKESSEEDYDCCIAKTTVNPEKILNLKSGIDGLSDGAKKLIEYATNPEIASANVSNRDNPQSNARLKMKNEGTSNWKLIEYVKEIKEMLGDL